MTVTLAAGGRREAVSAVQPGTTWDVTNHYITRPDHSCYGTNRRTITRTTSGRIYYAEPTAYRGESDIEWPKAAQVKTYPDRIELYGGGIGQGPADLFLTLRPVK